MHIVFLTNEFPFNNQTHGGIGTFVGILSRKLVEKNSDVSVVGITKFDSFHRTTEYGVQLFNIKQSRSKVAKFIFNSFRIRKLLKEIHHKNPIDIVEGAELSFAFLPNRTPYKKVIRMHGGHHFFAITLGKTPALWRSFQEKFSFKKADALIAVSEYVGSKTRGLLNLEMNYTVIFNFINLDIFKPKTDIDVISNAIFFVGTICKKKGVKELIDAFLILKEKKQDVTLHLIGRDWKDTEVGSYTDFVKSFIPAEIKNSIKFYGTVDYMELSALLSRANVCVYPSHSESFGLTLIEAMAMQKPIVASSIEPFTEIMENNKSGLMCNPFDSLELANHILELLSNKEKSNLLAKNARAVVINKFDIDKLLQKNITFYSSLV